MRYDVVAARVAERTRWARRLGYRDRPGQRILSVVATHLGEPRLGASPFRAPADPGTLRDGGFSEVGLAASEAWVRPRVTAGLTPYRAGATADGQRIIAFARGMTWLTVTSAPESGDYPGTAEEVALPGRGYAYYQPATTSLGRRVELFGRSLRVRLESNLPRGKLLEVAASVPVAALPIPDVVEHGGGRTVRRLDPATAPQRVGFSLAPGGLPPGYRPSVALLSRSHAGGATLTVYYRRPQAEYAGDGIRVTQSPSDHLLSPTSEDSFGVQLTGVVGRWFPKRGELEWIDAGVYRSVTVPDAELSTAVRIARSLL